MSLPFKYGKVVEDAYFINRQKEIAHLQQNFLSGINTIIISPRRWGKSSLVKKATKEFAPKHKNFRFVYLDMFNIRTESEFYHAFTTEIINATYTKWEDFLKNAKNFFSQLVPKLSIGIEPMNEFSIGLDWEEVQKKPTEILNLPEKISKEKNLNIVICIDEFQNLSFFEEPLEFQKKLRAHWQHHQKVNYCLYGSKRNMMISLFESKSMPFYKFGDLYFLSKIETSHWIPYIQEKFKHSKKSITQDEISYLVEKVENHPYLVQQLANNVWLNTDKKANKEIIEKSIDQLTEQYEMLFQRELDTLTNHQINFLKALVNKEEQLSNKKTLKKYNLGTSGNINRIKTALVTKEIIDIYNKKITFIDPSFKLWFERVYMK
jgi:hypothetical protein